jgi:hypothetical protein
MAWLPPDFVHPVQVQVGDGCVYIDPPEKQGADAEISWWVVDDRAGTSLEHALDTLVPQWIAAAWPFTQPRCIGRYLY